MHLRTRNVNTAFQELVEGVHTGRIPTEVRASRAGEVAMVEEPVTLTYEKPTERVLFNTARDANPFFHLYEALWMLAGRNDLAPLAYYMKAYEQFSDDGKTVNGAYGFRWRQAERYTYDGSLLGEDQLSIIINHLKKNPESRRAVLQMWNVEDDLLKIDKRGNYPCCEAVKRIETVPGDATTLVGGNCPQHGRTYFYPPSKDVCCNTHVYFSVGLGPCLVCKGRGSLQSGTGWGGIEDQPKQVNCPICQGKPHDQPQYLNMTVCNRSNDMILGMLGANAVHFSILQEYMAAHLGLEVGVYNQFTNNMHVYTGKWDPQKWLAEPSTYQYSSPAMNKVPLVLWPSVFDEEVKDFVERHSKDAWGKEYREPFLLSVAQPMMLAFHNHKRREYFNALSIVDKIKADDWRIAAYNWIVKRREAYEKKGAPADA